MKHIIQILITNLFSMSLVAATIQVGPTRSQKQLQPVKDGNEYVLDYGTYEFGPSVTVKKGLTIRSADPNARATIHFPSMWGQLPSGPDEGSPKGHSIVCYGNCVLKDVKTSGGEGVVVFNTQPGSTLLAQHIDMDGGGVLRGSGAKSIQIINVQSSGRPTAYFIANFTNQALEFLIDLSANTLPVKQGGHCMDGKPICDSSKAQGETAIRIMDTAHLVMKGVTIVPWLYDGKHAWKQDLQLRGPSGKYELFNVHAVHPDIGRMTWQNPAPVLKEVDFTDSVLDQAPHFTGGCQLVVYKNTKIAGKIVNASIPNPK